VFAATLGCSQPEGSLDRPATVVSTHDLRGARAAHAAIDAHGDVHVAFGTDGAIHVASSRDGGRRFGPPVTVAKDLVFALGMRRGPRIAASETSLCVAAVGGERGGGKDGDVLAWTSRDDGRTWNSAGRVNDEPGSAREGLFALAAGPGQQLVCIWLDLRHGKTELFGARSSDGGATWSKNELVYRSPSGSICECCAPSVAFDVRGGLHVMWRNHVGDARDMYLLDSIAAPIDWSKPFGEARKLGSGSWKLDACPMDGGAISVRDDGVVDAVWRRESEIFRTVDAEWRRGFEPFSAPPRTPELAIGTGMQPTIARGDADTFVAWIDRRGGALFVEASRTGALRQAAAHAVDPTLVARLDGRGEVALVWENDDGILCARVRPEDFRED
jgi:hypothetical protein